MCCDTHMARDQRDEANGRKVVYAEREEFRCQCQYGQACRRRATNEDMRCDWCSPLSENGHLLKCAELFGQPVGLVTHPVV